ncbi:MAG: Asp-tRNA(Asn)/Glu-tRNA(Gln) amidotransferase subunit GatC [Sulfolobales archaeon]
MSEDRDLAEMVRRSIRLAMIDVNEKEFEELLGEIKTLMKLVRRLDEIELGPVEPLFHVWEKSNPVREDLVVDMGEEIFEWLARSSRIEGRFVKAPKTVEER